MSEGDHKALRMAINMQDVMVSFAADQRRCSPAAATCRATVSGGLCG